MRQELEEREFTFTDADDVSARIGTLDAAAALIDAVPSLSEAVRRHVRYLASLEAEEAYDITHSEPRWPDWIFVSCPRAQSEVSALRAAENVVHEAMHLQLTQVERRVRLVDDEAARLHSPWKQEQRDARGNLHGLYVFAVLRSFFGRPEVRSGRSEEGLAYLLRRDREIAEEIALLDRDALLNALTGAGRQFVEAVT